MIEHVVVLGGGVAGLAAAAAVGDYVGRVTIVDRDRYPSRPEPRGGVPQSRHVHSLLVRGMRELDALVPGLRARLHAAGAVEADWTEQRFRVAVGWVPRFTSGHRGTFCSRALLEHELRGAVTARIGVRIVEGTEVVGLLGDQQRVLGVRVRPMGRDQRDALARGDDSLPSEPPARGPAPIRQGRGPAEVLLADLVIDATGRSSRLPEWLEELGIPAPAETRVTSNLGYASRAIAMPSGFAESWRFMLLRPPLPSTRGGVLYPVEGDRWMVTLGGIGPELPPHDEEGFLRFCHSLPDDFGDLVEAGEPLTRISSYRRTGNRWRHWDRVRPWPDGLLVLGDALCCFNPVYGQGMSVAAIQAGRLREAFATGSIEGPGAGMRLQRRLTALLADPWSMATGEDFRHPSTEGQRSPAMRAMHWYADQVLAAAARDPAVYLRFFETIHLLRPQRDLMTPPMMRRILRAARATTP